MSTAAEEVTVWIGFMDIVPVIGTVKEAVELVLAVYEGNEAVAKEKEKAIENIVKQSLNHVKAKHVNGFTLPDKPAAAAAEVSENVTAIRKEMIIECMAKGSKQGTKPPTLTQKEKQKRLEAINKDMLEKIRIINPKFSQELKEELGRSKKGEHVFNNNILKFHYKVLTKFIESKQKDPREYQQAMDTLGKHTLTQNTAEDIETNMVVDFGEDEFYVNANAVLYGEYCRALRDAMLNVLCRINPDDVPEEERQRVNFVIDNMNNLQIYVDQLAKVKWIAKKVNRRQAEFERVRQAQFERVRQEVANMYNTDRGLDWCIRILREVAPLLNVGSEFISSV